MKNSPKHVKKASMTTCSAGGTARHARQSGDLHLDEESLALFTGIQASEKFTAEAAHRAFAGVKRLK